MAKMTCTNGQISINGLLQNNPELGVYIFGGYKVNDVNNDTYLDSVNFDPIEVYSVGKVVTGETVTYTLTKLSETDVSDFIPDMTTPSTTESSGGTSPELLAIEKERAEREKEILQIEKDRRVEEAKAHKDLHSEEIVTTTDILGNEETHIKGHYPALS